MNSGQFAAFTECLPLGVALVDPASGLLQSCNARFARDAGRRASELHGLPWCDLLDTVDAVRAQAEVHRFIASGAPTLEAQWRFRSTDRPNQPRAMRLTRHRPEAAEADSLLLMVGAVVPNSPSDLEELVRLRTRDLVSALDEAESASRAKNAFLRTVSHELRTPLNAIIGFSSMLADDTLVTDPAERKKQLEIIQRSGEQLLELIEEILDITVIESGKLVVNVEPLRLRSLLLEQQDILRSLAISKQLELRPIECDEDIVVSADPVRLRQVVRNLLGNAVKFTDQGHVTVQVRAIGDVVRIEVSDTGIGIEAELQAGLFEPFERIAKAGFAVRPGTGLGLAISRRLVEAMGGVMGLESTPGQGSRFWFVLPRC